MFSPIPLCCSKPFDAVKLDLTVKDRDVRIGYSHLIEQPLPCRDQYYRNTAYLNSNRAENIIQCHEMVKVACVLKGVVRAIEADQRFFNSITAG